MDPAFDAGRGKQNIPLGWRNCENNTVRNNAVLLGDSHTRSLGTLAPELPPESHTP